MGEGIEEAIARLRATTEVVGQEVKGLKGHFYFQGEAEKGADHGEMIANIMLAYRHLEDARMRLGKVIQAKDGGKSVYNK